MLPSFTKLSTQFFFNQNLLKFDKKLEFFLSNYLHTSRRNKKVFLGILKNHRHMAEVVAVNTGLVQVENYSALFSQQAVFC